MSNKEPKAAKEPEPTLAELVAELAELTARVDALEGAVFPGDDPTRLARARGNRHG